MVTFADENDNQQHLTHEPAFQPTDARPDESCIICFDALEHGCVVTKCGHHFHDNCIACWFVEQEDKFQDVTCPMCRAKLANDNYSVQSLRQSMLTGTRHMHIVEFNHHVVQQQSQEQDDREIENALIQLIEQENERYNRIQQSEEFANQSIWDVLLPRLPTGRILWHHENFNIPTMLDREEFPNREQPDFSQLDFLRNMSGFVNYSISGTPVQSLDELFSHL